MRRRVVGVCLGTAALAGLFTGTVVGAVTQPSASPPPIPQTDEPTGPAEARQAAGPEPRFYSPTAVPQAGDFNPDFGYLRGLKDGSVLFDRVSLVRTPSGSIEMDNKRGTIRRKRLADTVRVLGGQGLTGSGGPTEVSIGALRRHLRESADSAPLLVWIRYDGAGRIIEVQEKGRP
jgi:hypothetical protein